MTDVSSTLPATGSCLVELFGTARLIACVREVALELAEPTAVRDLVPLLARECPSLVGQVLDVERRRLVESFVFNRNGRDFLIRPDALVYPGDRLLLLFNAAGG